VNSFLAEYLGIRQCRWTDDRRSYGPLRGQLFIYPPKLIIADL